MPERLRAPWRSFGIEQRGSRAMKSLLAAAATAALLTGAGAGVASAQMYQQPMTPPPSPMYGAPMQQQPMPQPAPISATPAWMQDDGSSSDHPIHNPGDVSGDGLNAQYRGGLTVPPGTGFPAQPNQQ
jgi:hypothetical protein